MGTVYLVGAGPGDPDLITVKGLRLIRDADVILYDRLIPCELLNEARANAELIDVGKVPGAHKRDQGTINALLIEKAQTHMTVVRLKDRAGHLQRDRRACLCRDSGDASRPDCDVHSILRP